MSENYQGAKAIADLIFEVSGQLIIGDEMRNGIINQIEQAELRGIRKGLEKAMDVCDPRVAKNDFERGLVEAVNRINALSPADIVREE